ncbi:hypothetical protein D3C85_968510 [compost metagenome]
MCADVVDEIAEGTLVLVVEVRLFLELGHDPARGFVGPVAEHHHVVAVVLEGLGFARVDHDRPVDTGLLLQARVAVVPIGAVLPHLESVLVHPIGGDAMEAQARHAVHVGRQDNAVPVNGGVFIQAVFHAQGNGIAFPPTQQRAGQGAIDGHGRARLAGDVDRGLADEQVEIAAAECSGLAGAGHGPYGRAPEAQAGQQGTGGEAFDEGASGGGWRHGVVSRGGMTGH